MPKAVLSNDKGLVQSSGNGLRLTPKNSNHSGLHFKTVEVDFTNFTLTGGADNRFLKATGITLPANSIIVAATAVVTERSDKGNLSLALRLDDDASALSVNDTTSGGEVINNLSIELGTGAGVVGKAFGGFLTSGTAVGSNVDVVLGNADGSNSTGAHASGKVVVTIGYSGTES